VIKNYVVLPFKDEPQLTANVLNDLHRQGDVERVYAINNGSSKESIDFLLDEIEEGVAFKELQIPTLPDAGIYEMWNYGWRMAQEAAKGPCNIAFLNNDIIIPPQFLTTLAKHLREDDDCWVTYPDYDASWGDFDASILYSKATKGTYQHGGMSGWAFMLKGEAPIPYVDEQFEWWYGDDDIVRNVTAQGKKVCRVVGLPLKHINEATARNGENEWTHQAKNRDTARFKKKWMS